MSERSTPSYESAVVVTRGTGLGRRHAIEGELVIGWDADRDIVVDDDDAVPYARLIAEADGVVLRREEASEIAIRVNDRAVDRTVLAHRDVIQVGFCLLRFIRAPDRIGLDSAFHDEIFRLSTIDPVTQVFNRRYFTEAFEREVSRVRRYDRSLSLALLEIDQLGRIAGELGRAAADELMHGVASLVETRMRQSDIVGHYDRELLAVLLPEEGTAKAAEAARGLCERVREGAFRVGDGESTCTISVGVAELDPGHATVDDLVQLATSRLRIAREGGGDRVVAAGG
jgi:diguanylate cyclase (GGDEF)-like protein